MLAKKEKVFMKGIKIFLKRKKKQEYGHKLYRKFPEK